MPQINLHFLAPSRRLTDDSFVSQTQFLRSLDEIASSTRCLYQRQLGFPLSTALGQKRLEMSKEGRRWTKLDSASL